MGQLHTVIKVIQINGIRHAVLVHYDTTILVFDLERKTPIYAGGNTRSDSRVANVFLREAGLDIRETRTMHTRGEVVLFVNGKQTVKEMPELDGGIVKTITFPLFMKNPHGFIREMSE